MEVNGKAAVWLTWILIEFPWKESLGERILMSCKRLVFEDIKRARFESSILQKYPNEDMQCSFPGRLNTAEKKASIRHQMLCSKPRYCAWNMVFFMNPYLNSLMGINFSLTFLQPCSHLQPTTSSWHRALLNRWLAQGLTCICLSLALVRDEWYKKILHSCWMKKIQSGPSEWNCYFQWEWFWTWYIFKGQLNLLGICERRSKNCLISLVLGLITVMLVIFLTNGDSSGSCFSQQLRAECMLQGDFPWHMFS